MECKEPLFRDVEAFAGDPTDVVGDADHHQHQDQGETDDRGPLHHFDRGRLAAYYAGADLMDPMKPGLTRTDDAPYPDAYLRPVPMLSGGSGLVSTLPDMLALVRSLLPAGPTLLKRDTIALMMTNQLPAGVWIRFRRLGELRGRGFGLAGALIGDSPNCR